MRPRALNQACLAVAQIITIIVCLSAVAPAQPPGAPIFPPSPQPSPPTVPTDTGGKTFSENLAALAIRAADLLPVIQNEIEGPLLPWLEKLAWGLAALIVIAAFAKMWRENAGAGVDLFWWFARLGVIFALMGSGPLIVDRMADIGQAIAVGGDGGAVLNRFYVKQRNSFDLAYVKFSEGMFTVKDTSVQPVPGGVLGVIFSTESSIQDASRKLDKISKDMSLLYDGLNFARGVMSFGDFFLTMLGSFLLIAMRLAAPIMIALAIDRSLAQKVTYPYAWGVAVLTLIWPVVALVIKSIAYLAGNIAMALGDRPVYKFDEATMSIIHSSLQQPVYTVLIAAIIMLIAGLCLWGSPYIAYQLSVGRVYEGVSTTVSSWVGQLMGAGIEYYSSSLASSISRQAEVTQAQGQYFGEVTRAGAGLERDNLQARASRIIGVTSAQGSLTSQLAGIEAGRMQQVLGLEAEKQFGLKSLDAQTGLEKNNIQTRKDLAVADQQVQSRREGAYVEADRSADMNNFIGQKIIRGTEWAGGAARTALADSKTGKQTLAGRAVGSVIEIGGGAAGLAMQYKS
ncbi:MAG: hypothetical protein MOB07_12985, partial [Acidobacteria bacterium]|nr:hypothetical protein [Acidobacteriota bacterium]